jgi:methylmalonyl-CoA/ethylmalonyl-CoA epimerase
MRLHHIGFVVASIEASVPGFLRSLGATWNGHIVADPIQKVKVAFIVPPSDLQIELVEASGKDSPVNRFLREKGPGLHHLCYEAKNLTEVLLELRSKGALLVRPPKPAIAFGGRQIAWLLTADKLLLELLEA